MLGAIVGDVVGSSYERSSGKDYNFQLFSEKSHFTDDTVCTLAVAETLMYGGHDAARFQIALRHWCRRYPHAGYGQLFKQWIHAEDPKPYNSYANGSAMRVSPVGLALPTLSETMAIARETALPTHGHLEGIKGAEAVAKAVWIARTANKSTPNAEIKELIRTDLEKTFGYDLSTPLEVIRPTYKFDVSCQGSVPQAIRCFLESTDFESAIRLAVSLGGDADTQACIAGAIAHAHYKKIPEFMMIETLARLPDSFVDLIFRFSDQFAVPLY